MGIIKPRRMHAKITTVVISGGGGAVTGDFDFLFILSKFSIMNIYY